ncbi:YsnF/AvaK domain-containing protein [Falsirhodobacter sp. 1013]|uniref:YsnF/AvaK domain-containing protein n=1 Tax=Falsirhodobacter sp. 1013 TaxID=3417566 RepID=UPI003EC0AA35
MTYNTDIDTVGNTTISSLFDSQSDAERAIERLREVGIASSQIRTVEGTETTTGTVSDPDHNKGFWDKLGDYFFPDEDRYSYAEGLSRGGYLVTVTGLTDAEYDAAQAILDDEGTVNLDEREESWRSEGWGGYGASSYATAGAGSPTLASTTDHLTDDATIPVVEERLRVGKRDASRGHVRVRAYTVEEPVSESVELREDHVELERRPVDRAAVVDEDFRDRTIEAEEYREEAVVSKDARVVEEIGLRKTSDTHRETISDSVRHTEVEIDDDRDDLGQPKKPL